MVAATESRIIKREKDFCRLNAILRAINDEMFTIKSYSTGVIYKPNSAFVRPYSGRSNLNPRMVNSLFLKLMKRVPLSVLSVLFLLMSFSSSAQREGDAQAARNIHSIKLYRSGDQASFPALILNGGETLELHFDDLGNSTKNYYYTFQLCNADWSPSMLSTFEYIKGFQSMRINTYRNSSMSTTRYIHYTASFPDRNMTLSRSGNYLLKVFLDGDTSRTVFTRRFVVVSQLASITGQIQQPFNAKYFRTAQKLNLGIQTDSRIQVFSPSDLKIVVLQNNNWHTSLFMDRPTIYRGNYYEYNDEAYTSMPAGKEFRWIDLTSLRLMSDRMLKIENVGDTSHIYVKPEANRAGQTYVYYRDLNGSYVMETQERNNPFWQSDYAYVHFSFMPSGKRQIEGSDVYVFGELTNYAQDTLGKMNFNEEKGIYEKTLYLKQGFYNYSYITLPQGKKAYPDFSQTEGDHWATENSYVVLVYYRPFGNRADELIGYSSLSSVFQRTGF